MRHRVIFRVALIWIGMIFWVCAAGTVFALPDTDHLTGQDLADKVRQHFGVVRFDRRLLSVPTDVPDTFALTINHKGKAKEVFLWRHSVRADNYKLRVYRDGRCREQAPAPVRTYQGVIVDELDSTIAASLEEDGLSLSVYKNGKRQWSLKPLSKALKSAQRGEHILYEAEDEIPEPGVCGVLETPGFSADLSDEGVAEIADGNGTAWTDSAWASVEDVDPDEPLAAIEPGCQVHKAQIAFDVDYTAYKMKFGCSLTAAQNRVDTIVNEQTLIYSRDARIVYALTGLIVRQEPFYAWSNPAESDPSTCTFVDNSTDVSLATFRTKWENGSAGNGGFTYDLAHLVTADNPGGILGTAYVNTVCGSSRYAWSVNTVGVIAHEIGHNWGLSHCNNNGDCHIMCSGYGGCEGNPSFFGDPGALFLLDKAPTKSCIQQVNGSASPAVPPRAFDDNAGSLPVNDLLALGSLDIDVLANDHDGNCDALTISDYSSPTPLGATLSVNGGLLAYIPNGSVGTDTFTYTCTDGNGGYDTASVTLVIEPSTQIGLVGHWTLDDGGGSVAADSSGNDFHATLGGSETWTSGIIDGALQYPSQESPTAAVPNMASVDELSFSAWFNHAETGSDQYFGRGIDNGSNEWRIYRYGGYGHIQIDTPGDSSASWYTGITPSDNQWHHLAVVFDDRALTVRLYLDGVLRGSRILYGGSMVEKTLKKVEWGAGVNGMMDDVRVYDVALTEQEVQVLYVMGAPIAVDPWPVDGAAEVAQNAVLNWLPGTGFNPASDTHQVYIGPSQASMTLAGSVSDPFFDPDLAWSTPYVWRVDEVIDGTTYTGLLWSFDTTGVRVCDPPLLADTNDDCLVDMKDLAQVAADWLLCTHINNCP